MLFQLSGIIRESWHRAHAVTPDAVAGTRLESSVTVSKIYTSSRFLSGDRKGT